MKVLGISGSPRVKSNTSDLIKVTLKEIEKEGIETEFITLAQKVIKPCNACMYCEKVSECSINDDDFAPIYEKILKAEGLIIGCPVYFGSATPELKALIDRTGYIARKNGGLLKRKVGAPIAVARRAGKTFTFAQLSLFYAINDMIQIGSSYWNIAVGRNPGEALIDDEGVKTMINLGQNIAWVMKKLFSYSGQ